MDTTTPTTNDLIQIMATLRRFIPAEQLQVMAAGIRGEEGDYFRSKLMQIAEQVEAMPRTYDQDGAGDNAVVHLHYFAGACDWYITERDREDVQHQAFGLADLGYGGELGYISLVELCQHPVVNLDLFFEPKTLGEIKAGR